MYPSDECDEGQVCVNFECKADAIDDDDRDGVANEDDNCPETFNPEQSDQDSDSIGDACDTDRDNDTVEDDVDNCVDVPNLDQTDIDQDGIGDACDDELPGPVIVPNSKPAMNRQVPASSLPRV